MAGDDKKGKTEPAAKKADAPGDKRAPESGAAPANYSRGEGQKPVTQAYKDNWNAIFAKKTRKTKR